MARPHGIQGALRLEPVGEDPARLLGLTRLWLGSEPVPRAVEELRLAGGRPIVRLAGITSVDAAEAYRGQAVWRAVADRPPLPRDSYYVDQLVGLTVVDGTGRVLGRVTGVEAGVGQDRIQVQDPAVVVHLVPAVRALVREVDLAAGRLRVEPLPGLFGGDRP